MDGLAEILTDIGRESYDKFANSQSPPLTAAAVKVQSLINHSGQKPLEVLLTEVGQRAYKRFVGRRLLVPMDVSVQSLLNHRR